jgi:Gas vesicle protein K
VADHEVPRMSARRRAPARSRKKRPPPPPVTKRRSVTSARLQEIEALRSELARRTADAVPRWNANPEDVRRSVAKLVLSLVEFLRKLLERQAIRRMEAETLSVDEVEAVGLALMRLEETVRDLAARFELSPEELNLDLGPLGRLM